MKTESLGIRKAGKIRVENGDFTTVFWIIDEDITIVIYENIYFYSKFHEEIVKKLEGVGGKVIPFIAISPDKLRYTSD